MITSQVLHLSWLTAYIIACAVKCVSRVTPEAMSQCRHILNMSTHSLSVLTFTVCAYCLQVKIWNMQSGFCFVTFSEHSAPVTAVAFLPSGSVVVSASLDGTVRAFDLVRYRNFRTMTSPHPVQFVSLAVDPAGEVTP